MSALSLDQQIRRKCKHFTGIMDKVCRVGVIYQDVKEPDTRPFVFPCVDPGCKNCPKREYLTEDEIQAQLKAINEGSVWALTTIVLIRDKFKKDGLNPSWIECPTESCKGKVNYSIADSVNNHIWATCIKCGRSFNE